MVETLSNTTRVLWAKLSRQNDNWLPLYIHMADSAEMARLLWRYWLPNGVKRLFIKLTSNAEALFIFLAASHDLGKASPVFQIRPGSFSAMANLISNRLKDAGLPLPSMATEFIPHAHISQLIAMQNGLPRHLSIVLGGHHGSPPSHAAIQSLEGYPNHIGLNDKSWINVQNELFEYAFRLSGIQKAALCNIEPGPELQMLLTGLVIMVDWLVSDADKFSYIGPNESCVMQSFADRAALAWEKWGCSLCWEALDEDTLAKHDLYDLYKERFGKERCNFTPRLTQKIAAEKALEITAPGIIILEAPMGEGKTEAALVMAEILAAKKGRGGVFFALPTQATSNGIFPRMIKWIKALEAEGPRSIILAHGKAVFNEEYRGLLPGNNHAEGQFENDVSVNEWFCGRKKGLLADFVVGTIDQLLMAGLKQRHLALRHLGLANKVVIIDECHAYDAYMNSYLHKALNWLGKMQVPVIVLSATLPGHTRQKLMEAYLRHDFTPVTEALPWLGIKEQKVPPPAWVNNTEYPMLTYSDGDRVEQLSLPASNRKLKVKTQAFDIGEIGNKLEELLVNGGCAGIIVNTVTRAQDLYLELATRFGGEMVRLLHSRFIPSDRADKEAELRRLLGPNDNDKDNDDSNKRPAKLIVVGTQVMEQSLDIDFDVLFTDICPMDLLIQRIGRLHRHNRERPARLAQACCFVTGVKNGCFEAGSKAVYGQYMLMNTLALLPSELNLPENICTLVQKAYDEDGLFVDTPEYAAAKAKHLKQLEIKAGKAKSFQIAEPDMSVITGLLDAAINNDDPKGHKARAAVRDTHDSVEVLVLCRRKDHLYTLPWGPMGDKELPCETTPDDELAQALAACTLALPAALTAAWNIGKTIEQLEKANLRQIPALWQQSHWLKDELFLVLDENFCAELGDYVLQYNQNWGLAKRKKSEV